MARPVVIAMMGLPRSGKSTIAKTLALCHGYPIVNRDAMRLAFTGQRYQPVAEDFIKTIDKYFIKSLFLAGHETVVVDETNYSPEARAHLEDPMWDIEWFPVLTKPEICMDRAVATNQNDLLPVIMGMFDRYVPLPSGSRVNKYWKDEAGGPTHDKLDLISNIIR